MITANDRIVTDAIAADPRRGFALLMQRFKEPVYWHIRRMVVNHADAEDATQETFVKIYRSLDIIEEVRNLNAWVYRIATNEALRLLQQRAPAAVPLETDADTDMLNLYADEYFDYTDLEGVAIQRAIGELPEKQRLIFSLRYFDELPYSDIAEVARTSVAAAKVSYHIAKNKVLKSLQKIKNL